MNTQIGIPAPRVAPDEKEVEALAYALYLWRTRFLFGDRYRQQEHRHNYFLNAFRMGTPDKFVDWLWPGGPAGVGPWDRLSTKCRPTRE